MRSRSASAGFLLLSVLFSAVPIAARAEPPPQCVRADIVLWGDGKHDDTFALNAWLRGENIAWADSGDAVGNEIAGRAFRLMDAIYITAGSGRVMRDFRLLWPERGETVSGGTIVSGDDPDKPPVSTDVAIVGGDPGEGVPFDAPDPVVAHDPKASCATS
jgi:hypothetical protein